MHANKSFAVQTISHVCIIAGNENEWSAVGSYSNTTIWKRIQFHKNRGRPASAFKCLANYILENHDVIVIVLTSVWPQR